MDTLVRLAQAAANAKAGGVTVVPWAEAANAVGKLVKDLQVRGAALGKAIAKAESMHEHVEEQAQFLTSTGADAAAAVRGALRRVGVGGGG